MPKKKVTFDFAKEDAELDALGKKIGITDDDMRDVETLRAGRPGQRELAKESEARNHRHSVREAGIQRELDVPNEVPNKSLEVQIRSAVQKFKAAPAGAEKEKHRAAAWSMVEGVKRTSVRGEARPTSDDPTGGGRRTRISFVPDLDMPCINGRCHNTVPYNGPKTEPEGSPVTAGITTCSGGKCDIPGAVASRPAER
jgi:hypothetical protein